MSLEMKSFGAFVWQLARYGVRQAVPLARCVRHPGDNIKQVRQEIVNDIGRGLITPERAAELQGFVTVCIMWHRLHGHVEEHHDRRDWASLGEGCHMRLKHLDENYEAAGSPEGLVTLEQKLMEEENEEG